MYPGETPGFNPEENLETSPSETPYRLRKAAELWLNRFVNGVDVAGEENIAAIDSIRAEDPEATFVVSSSHDFDEDAPATIKVLGEKLDLLITAESVLFGLTPEDQIMFRAAGKDNFKPISYKKTKKGNSGKQGVFDPDDFSALVDEMEQGKSPWIASHAFSGGKGMSQVKIGSVYLAQKTGSYIIPTAIEKLGPNIRLDTPLGILKAMRNKNKVSLKYHVGVPFKLEPIDVTPIDHLMALRKAGKRASKDEIKAASEAHQKLKEQAEMLARKIAEMLPEEQRGNYR